LIIQPKGRAIQVEDSIVERQPSIDVRRPRNRDFNVIEVYTQSVYNNVCAVAACVFVVITVGFEQIKLLESSDDYSGSGNSTVMDASLEGESMAGNKGNILYSCSERDEVVSGDQLEDVKKAEEDSSVLKRSD